MVGDGSGGCNNLGSEKKWFSGTFDGNWHTLTFNAGTTAAPYTPAKGAPTAPFSVIDGATIKNLMVQGTIVSTRRYSAGLVGHSYSAKTGRDNNIKNCIVSVNINCKNINNSDTDTGEKVWDCSAAGFAAENKKDAVINFENCIFDGSIVKNGTTTANRAAGFVAYNTSTATQNSIKYTHCLMMGSVDLNSVKSTFSRNTHLQYLSGCQYGPNYGEVPS